MLLVIFQLGNDRYALDARHVVEIVPLLALKRIPQAPKPIAGIFSYRGRPLPAIDLCQLILGRPAYERLSTRIIVVNHGDEGGHNQQLGLIAERTTATQKRDPREFKDLGVNLAATPYLGPILMDDHGDIQLLHTQKLLTQNIERLLSPAVVLTEEPGH